MSLPGRRDDYSVRVRVMLLPESSEPGRQVFVYFIEVTNDGLNAGQLLDRHWVITEASGRVEEVHGEGEGVIGKQPMIVPGETYRYDSFVVLRDPPGVMRGWFDFRSDDGSRFTVPVPEFVLALPGEQRVIN